jgi:hypothetical protein
MKKRGKKTGGASLDAVLAQPSKHQAEFNQILAVAKKTSGGRRKKGGAIPVPEDMYLNGRMSGGAPTKDKPGYQTPYDIHQRIARLGPDAPIPIGGRMSKLVPRHGHGASTSIGTNYQLGQFGGGAIQPIGNTAVFLSPALSGMSVGAGRSNKTKGKNLKKLLAAMVKARKQLHGAGFMDDAYNLIKDISTGLYHEFGAEIFGVGKDILLEALKEGAAYYIHGKDGMDGGNFWGDVLNGLKSVGTWLWDTLKEVLNSAIVKEIEHELVTQGLALAKEYAAQQFASGAPPPSGAGRPGHGVRHIGGLRHGQFNLYRGKKTIDENYKDRINESIYPVSSNPELDRFFRKNGGIFNPNKNFDPNRIVEVKKKGGRKPIGADPRTFTPKHGFDMDDMFPLFPSPVPDPIMIKMGKGRPGANGHGVRKIGGLTQGQYNLKVAQAKLDDDYLHADKTGDSIINFRKDVMGLEDAVKQGGKKPSARGAIVKRIMKEKNLSLPMASKYVKEHGLY